MDKLNVTGKAKIIGSHHVGTVDEFLAGAAIL
jgi:hypothetical protein